MNKEEIKKIYKYFEISKMVEELEKDIKQIIKIHSDIDMEWGFNLSSIVELEKQYNEKSKKYYLFDGNDIAYQQDNYFIWQRAQYDNFYGYIYYPLEDNKYLKIEYSC